MAPLGSSADLAWLPDGEHIAVSGDNGSGVLSTIDGSYRPAGDTMFGLAVSEPGEPVVQMATSELVQDAGTGERQTYVTGEEVKLKGWYGAVWVSNSMVARTSFLADGEQAIALIDLATARVTHVLTLPTGATPDVRSNGCCATLGWLVL